MRMNMNGIKNNHKNDFLEERLIRNDSWMSEGKIPFSSKIVPVSESLSAEQWVLPSCQVLELLRNARSIAVIQCVCRNHYNRCDNPREVCLVLDDEAGMHVEKGEGRYVTIDEAKEILHTANRKGLVHCTIYNPSQHPYAICSCCPCCCHEFQFLRLYGRRDLVVHSDYVAVTDMKNCNHCGVCVDRCHFEARKMKEGEMEYEKQACYGCGLCVTECPVQAIALERR